MFRLLQKTFRSPHVNYTIKPDLYPIYLTLEPYREAQTRISASAIRCKYCNMHRLLETHHNILLICAHLSLSPTDRSSFAQLFSYFKTCFNAIRRMNERFRPVCCVNFIYHVLFKQKREMQLDLFCKALHVSSHMSVKAQTAAAVFNFFWLPVEIRLYLDQSLIEKKKKNTVEINRAIVDDLEANIMFCFCSFFRFSTHNPPLQVTCICV